MKTKERSDIVVSGNLGGEEIELTLDETSLPHLMGMYIRMYQDPEMATLREIATNARDAHIAAGKSKVPIEITLPTKLHPVLQIEDWGVGLDEDDFRNIYSKYGASTKRNTNKQTGALGIGCKAPLAYSAAFTVEGYKNGRKTIAQVSRDKAAGVIRILNPGGTPTQRENGVIVKVPAPVDNRLQLKAERLFQFWPKGAVLVDGKEIPTVQGLQITKDILISKNLRTNYIVMGGVPYEYNDEILSDDDYKVVAYIEMGSVDFAPSRETLELTPDTLARIEQISDEANKGIAESIQKKINKAKTHPEAAKVMAENVGLVDMRKHSFKYKGEEIPYTVDATVISTYSGSWKQSDHNRSRSLAIQSYTKQLVITDFTPNNFHASHKKKIEQYVDENNVYDPETVGSAYPRYMRYFICLPEVPAGLLKWVPDEHIVPWEEIRKIKLPSVGRGGTRVAGTYECWTQDGYQGHVDEDDVDALHPLLYSVELKGGPSSTQKRLLNHFYPEWTVAVMGGNRVNKFKRLFPKAEQIWDHTTKLEAKFKSTLTKEQKEYLKYHSKKDELCRLNPDNVKDKELAKLIRLVKTDRHNKVAALAGDLGIDYAEREDVWKGYPMLRNLFWYSYRTSNIPNEHMELYINAVYTANNGNGKKGK